MAVFRSSCEVFYAAQGLEEMVDRLHGKYSRCLIVVDSNLKETAGLDKLRTVLAECTDELQIHYRDFQGEPTYSELDSLTDQFRAFSPELIAGVGGGSVLDISKGLSVTLISPATSAMDFRGMNLVTHPNLPCLLVPSTAGSGSEMTYTSSLIDESSGVKLGINGDNVFARYALLLPDFLLSAPDSVVIGSALDVLVHATEALTSSMRTRFVEPFAISAVRLVLTNLNPFITMRNSGGIPAKQAEELLIAASQAGMAMLNSSGGMASAISYPVGTAFRVPHGFAGGIPLPFVLELQEDRGISLSSDLGLRAPLSQELFELYSEIHVPQTFVTWGVSPRDKDLLISRVIGEKSESLQLGPLGADVEVLGEVIGRVVGL